MAYRRLKHRAIIWVRSAIRRCHKRTTFDGTRVVLTVSSSSSTVAIASPYENKHRPNDYQKRKLQGHALPTPQLLVVNGVV